MVLGAASCRAPSLAKNTSYIVKYKKEVSMSSSPSYKLGFRDACKAAKILLFNRLVKSYEAGEIPYSAQDFFYWSSLWMLPDWPLLLREGRVIMHEEQPVNRRVLDVPLKDLSNGLRQNQAIQALTSRLNSRQLEFVAQMGVSLGQALMENKPKSPVDEDSEAINGFAETHLKKLWDEQAGSLGADLETGPSNTVQNNLSQADMKPKEQVSSGNTTESTRPEQHDSSTKPLSWPDTASAGQWIGVFLLAGFIGFMVAGVIASCLFMTGAMTAGQAMTSTLEGGGGSSSTGLGNSLVCMSFPLWIVGWLVISAGIVWAMGKRLNAQTAKARAERKITIESLGAVAAGEATCLTPTTLNVPAKVVLVLTRDNFAVYAKQPFVKGFECLLSNLAGVATCRDHPALPANSMEITFVKNGNPFVGQFSGLQEINGEQWADRITAIRQRGIA
jgi:hypothetical protein